MLDRDQQHPALAELARICTPDGEIRLLEYAYSANPRQRFIMRLWAPRVEWAYGARFDRNTETYVTGAGLDLLERRFLLQDVVKMLVMRPAADAATRAA